MVAGGGVMTMDVSIEPTSLRRARRELANIRNGLPRAISTAVRRTTDTARSRIVKAVAKDLNIKQRDLYKRGARKRPIRQKFERAGSLITGGVVEVTGRRIPLGRFAARQTKAGVSYKIDRGGSRKTITSGFIPRLDSGYQGVFKRKGKNRLPIVERFGPSVPHVAAKQPAVAGLMRFDATNLLDQNLGSQVDRLLKRKTS